MVRIVLIVALRAIRRYIIYRRGIEVCAEGVGQGMIVLGTPITQRKHTDVKGERRATGGFKGFEEVG
jgi:hypothetical protein